MKALEFVSQFDVFEHLWAQDMNKFLIEFTKTGRPLSSQEQWSLPAGSEVKGLPPKLEDFNKKVRINY